MVVVHTKPAQGGFCVQGATDITSVVSRPRKRDETLAYCTILCAKSSVDNLYLTPITRCVILYTTDTFKVHSTLK